MSADSLIVPIYDISAGTGYGLSLASVLVCDDSVEPTLFQGDWALVEMSQRPSRPNEVYVYRHAGELHLKRLRCFHACPFLGGQP